MHEHISKQANDLGRDPVGPLLLRLALPAICAQVVNLLYSIVDRIFIGHIPVIGATALTGVGVTFPIITLIAAFAALIGMGGAPHLSIAMGEEDYKKAARILGTCTVTLWVLSVVLTVCGVVFLEPLLYAFGASPDTFGYGFQYMRIYLLGTIFVQTALGLNGFITAQGFAKTAMITTIIGAGLNLVLDPIFIFLFGMGVRGAALATVISQAVSAVWVCCFLWSSKPIVRLTREMMRLDFKLLGPVIALGLAPFIMQSTESLLTITFNRSLLRYGGDIAVGAMTILASVTQMVQMPLFGLAQGAQPILSYNLGARQVDRMRQTIRYQIKAAFLYAFVAYLLIQLIPRTIAGFFSSDAALLDTTAWALRIYLAVGFVIAFQTGFQQAFVAMGQAKISLFIAFLRKIILLIPLILILPHFFRDQVLAVFLAEPIADALAAVTTTVLFLLRFRSIVRMLEQES